MLLRFYQLLLDDPFSFLRLAVLVIFSVLVAITVHEFSHAMLATGLGDHTARRQGRLSLNPVRHLDPTGSLLLLLAGFGWGKPVPVNQHRLSNGATGMALVAAAGPLSNLVVAFLLGLPIKLGLLTWTSPGLGQVALAGSGGFLEGLADIVGLLIFFNLLLGVFNLIPLVPLDGSRVLAGILPRNLAASYARLEQYGPIILVTIVLLDIVLGLGILWRVIGPIVGGLSYLATGY